MSRNTQYSLNVFWVQMDPIIVKNWNHILVKILFGIWYQ